MAKVTQLRREYCDASKENVVSLIEIEYKISNHELKSRKEYEIATGYEPLEMYEVEWTGNDERLAIETFYRILNWCENKR